ncbi:hypothetical protein Bca101_046559 [Brassica carinata]
MSINKKTVKPNQNILSLHITFVFCTETEGFCARFSLFLFRFDRCLSSSFAFKSNGDGEQDNKTKAEELQTQSGIFTTLFSGEVTEAGESFIFSSLFSVLSSPARWRRRKFQLCKSLLRRGG